MQPAFTLQDRIIIFCTWDHGGPMTTYSVNWAAQNGPNGRFLQPHHLKIKWSRIPSYASNWLSSHAEHYFECIHTNLLGKYGFRYFRLIVYRVVIKRRHQNPVHKTNKNQCVASKEGSYLPRQCLYFTLWLATNF